MGAQAHRATQSAKPKEIERSWYVIDAEDLVLGRMCTRVASVLKGKHRTFVTPHVDCGDHVWVEGVLVGQLLETLAQGISRSSFYHRCPAQIGQSLRWRRMPRRI